MERTRGKMRAVTDSLRLGREPLNECLFSSPHFSNQLSYRSPAAFFNFWSLLISLQYGQGPAHFYNHKPLLSIFRSRAGWKISLQGEVAPQFYQEERKPKSDAGGGVDLVARSQERSCLVFLFLHEIGSNIKEGEMGCS